MANASLTVERREQMFPVLTAPQIARIASVGRARRVRAGEIVFDLGEQNTAFHVVITGSVEIISPTVSGEVPVVVHGPGQFTGEINMLSGRRSLVRARAKSDGDLIELQREHLRTLVQRDPELSDILMRAFILRRLALLANGLGNLVLLGSRHSSATMAIKEFLSRNGHPFTYQDVERDPDVQTLLDRFHVGVTEVPVVVCEGGHVLRRPSVEELARRLGLSATLDGTAVRDVVVIGAGPAGLAAAVYGASEGLDVLVLEGTAPGGQAGTSSRIENYLGFPTGISGEALAGRALNQAQKFGADVAIGRRAIRLDCDERPYRVHLGEGDVVRTRSIVVATGAQYRRPALPELERFEGAGVFYSATHLEAQMCDGDEVAVVGGGNSAGQAAVFLCGVAKHVHVLVRGAGLAESMSRYLIQRIETSAGITLRTRTQVEALHGEQWLEQVRWRRDGDDAELRPVRHVFMMTGADPKTKWLEGCVALDDKGFVKTGADLTAADVAASGWPLVRRPHLLETTIPGVFAVGDVRSNSVKRVASAVGEGSICIQLVHRTLQEL